MKNFHKNKLKHQNDALLLNKKIWTYEISRYIGLQKNR